MRMRARCGPGRFGQRQGGRPVSANEQVTADPCLSPLPGQARSDGRKATCPSITARAHWLVEAISRSPSLNSMSHLLT